MEGRWGTRLSKGGALAYVKFLGSFLFRVGPFETRALGYLSLLLRGPWARAVFKKAASLGGSPSPPVAVVEHGAGWTHCDVTDFRLAPPTLEQTRPQGPLLCRLNTCRTKAVG